MRRLLPTTIVLAGLLAGCGSTVVRMTTVVRPPNLGPPTAEARVAPIPTQQHYKPKHGRSEQAVFRSGGGCGLERWAVKTLTDPNASQVTLTPQDSTVADLVSIAPPVSPTDRVNPTEETTFRISGTLTFAKVEADGDYHLVLADAQGNTMIAESTSPSCAHGSVVMSQLEGVRQALDQRFPELAAGQVIKPGVAATVTGVGFFDRLHGQTGVAANGIELHPLLSVQLP
jgi:hypothetical protein